MDQTAFLTLADGCSIAYRHTPGEAPGVLFCAGFNSNMQGIKALALERWCRDRGRQFTRFDYSGHGESGGSLEDGCIGRWCDDTLAVLDRVTSGPQVIVGSSMGGWIMLLVALQRADRVKALLGLAAAPDFTARLRTRLTAAQRQQLDLRGYVDLPNCYDDGQPYRIGGLLLDEGDTHLLLDGEIAVDVPVRLIQGQCDEDVPWQLALSLAARIRAADVEVQLVKSGDHRLSGESDLRRLEQTLEQLLQP